MNRSGKGTASQAAEKLPFAATKRPQGLKPTLILRALRGAKAPLFHEGNYIQEFFRSLFSRAAQSQ
jgi:hypothetical protein